MWWSALNPVPGRTSWPFSVAENTPNIKALFFSPRTIWLLPNDLLRSQFQSKFFDDIGLASSTDNVLEGQVPARACSRSDAPVFPAGRYPRLETFTSLERALARELDQPEMDNLGRRLILYDLARTLADHMWPNRSQPAEVDSSLPSSNLFSTQSALPEPEEAQPALSGADLKSLADDLGDGFDRLKLAGLSWDQVAQLPPAGLGRLLADLGRRHDQLLAGLGRRDRFARRRQVLDELCAGRKFQALAEVKEIVCRWSQRLSPFETDFILALARGRQLQLTLKVPSWVRDENIDHGSGFDLLRSIRRIEKCQEPTLWFDFSEYQTGADGPRPSVEPSSVRYPDLIDHTPPPALAYAADVLLAPAAYRRPDPPDPTDNLKVIRAASAYQEVEEAARLMKESLRRPENLKAEDLALVVPDLDRYGPLLDDVSRRFGLAFYLRRGDSLAETGPARAIIDLLTLWSSNWERGRLLELIRNPYFQLGLDPVASHRLAVEAGVTDHRAGGGFEDNLSKINTDLHADGPAARSMLDLLKRLKQAGRRLDQSPTWGEFMFRFKKLLNDLAWPGDLSLAPLEPNIRAADLAAAQALAREMDRLGQAFDESPRPPSIGLANFRLWLETVLKDSHLNWDRNPEGRIRVLNYYDLHGGFFEEIFFLGLGERIFPQTAPESRWWPEELVRGAAELLGRPLWSEAADRYRQEELLFATGLGQARRRVWLFYPAGDDSGRQVAPSPLLTTLTELWTDENGISRLPVETASRAVSPPLIRVAGPDELWVTLAALPPEKWLRSLLKRPETAEVMEQLHRRRERWRQQKNEAFLSPEVMRTWLTRRPTHEGRPLLTPNFLAAFEDCPLAFWGREVLGLSAEGDPIEEWPRTSEGTVVHRVLEVFFQSRLGSGPGQPGPPWPGPADYETCRVELMDILNQEIDRCVRCDPLGRAPLWELRRARLPEILSAWLRREMSSGSELRPLSLEWSFGTKYGREAEPWFFDLGDGEGLYFQGRADRLDQTEEGLSLRDYKLRLRDDFKLRGRNKTVNRLPTRVWPILTYALAAADLLGQKVEAGFDIIEADSGTGRLIVLSTDDPEMCRPDPKAGGEGLSFPQKLSETWQALGEGHFSPTGEMDRHCAFCGLGLLCPRQDQQEDELGSGEMNGRSPEPSE